MTDFGEMKPLQFSWKYFTDMLDSDEWKFWVDTGKYANHDKEGFKEWMTHERLCKENDG